MATIFSSDSKTPGWSNVVHLIGLSALVIGGFYGFMFLWCNMGIAIGLAGGAALVAFFSIQRGATELGKWGRFKSSSIIWLMFFLSVISAGLLTASTIYMLAYDDHWRSTEAELHQGIQDGVAIVHEYESLRQAYLSNVEKRLTTARRTQYLGGNAAYIGGCPYLLTGRLTESSVTARLNVLESNLNDLDSSIRQQLSLKGDTLLSSFLEVGFVQRCSFPEKIFDFQTSILSLKPIFESNIANADCDADLLNRAQGEWIRNVEDLARAIGPQRSQWEFRALIGQIKLHYSLVAIFIFALTFSPLFSTRGTLGGTSRKSETEL